MDAIQLANQHVSKVEEVCYRIAELMVQVNATEQGLNLLYEVCLMLQDPEPDYDFIIWYAKEAIEFLKEN